MRRTTGLVVMALLVLGVGACGKKANTTASTTTTAGQTTTTAAQTSTTVAATIGHPTDGFHPDAAPPSDFDDYPDDFGQNVALTVTKDGDPVVAYEIHDANHDGTDTDSSLYASAWDPKKGQFTAPAKVDGIRAQDAENQVSLATDRTSGTIALTYDDGGGTLVYRTSTDNGATWSSPVTVHAAADTPRSPSVAIANGKAIVSFTDDPNPVVVASIDGATVTEQPAPSEGGSVLPQYSSAAASKSGTLAVTYIQNDDAQGGVIVDYWPVGTAAAVHAVDSEGVQNDNVTASLTFTGDNPVVGTTMSRQSDGGSGLGWYAVASADKGASFLAPVAIPPDNSDGQGFHTRIAATDSGKGIFAYHANSSSGDAACGEPKVSRSVDLKTWKTCSPDQDNTQGISPGVPSLATAGDTVFVAFTNYSHPDPSENKLGAGVWVWVSH